MKLVVQRVNHAKVAVEGKTVGEIGRGLLVFLGVHKEDKSEDTTWLVNKLINLRIFENDDGKMNISVKELGGQILVVSQFTLYGNCANGRRPDFMESAPGLQAEPIYQKFVNEVADEMGKVETGVFGAHMKISLENDGPVTLIVEGRSRA